MRRWERRWHMPEPRAAPRCWAVFLRARSLECREVEIGPNFELTCFQGAQLRRFQTEARARDALVRKRQPGHGPGDAEWVAAEPREDDDPDLIAIVI